MESTASGTLSGVEPTPRQNDNSRVKWPKIEQDSTCIRLLEVLPLPGGQKEGGGGGGGDSASIEIECLFHLVDVETTDLTYDTLSYAWGASPPSKTIRINGYEHPVRENVYAALAKLRRERSPSSYLIWVDAVCINQADSEEKTHEVNLMQQIYANCAMCNIWLSNFAVVKWNSESSDNEEEDEEDGERLLTPAQIQAGFDMLALICQAAEEDTVTTTLPASLATASQCSDAATAVMTMVYDDWWVRLWTVQEAVLAPRAQILWGDLSIGWEKVELASEVITWEPTPVLPFDILETYLPAMNELAARAGSVRIVRHIRESPLDLLWRFRYRQASNPRDKIYGLMGLMGLCYDEEQRGEESGGESEEGSEAENGEGEEEARIRFSTMRPCDYTLDVVTLYKRVTLDLIRLEDDLMPLIGRRGERGPTAAEGLPSWAIDWMENPDRAKRYSRYWPHCWVYEYFRADDNTPIQMAVSSDDDESVLSLGGVFVDRITEIGSPPPRTHQHDEQHDPWQELCAHIEGWRGLAAGFVARKPSTRENFMSCSWEDRFQNLIDGVFPGEIDVSKRTENEWTRDMCMDQSLLLAENGHIGLGPFTAQPGDEIWILFGGTVPFVLRPREQEERGDSYEFVGDAFVYDIMSGEFSRDPDKEHRTAHLY